MAKLVHMPALWRRKNKALKAAIREAGGVSEVVRFINVNYNSHISRQAVANWKVCPPLRAAQVAAAAQARGGKSTVVDLYPEFALAFSGKRGSGKGRVAA